MKKLLLIFFVAMSFYNMSCTDNRRSKRILEDLGMTNVKITGHRFFTCGEDDTYSTGFIAYKKNKKVSGTVCCGIMKGCTVRYD